MIEPYKDPRPHKEIAWLLDEDNVLREHGGTGPLTAALAEGVQVWGQSELLRYLTRQGHGSAVLWRYQAIGWHPDRTADSWPVRGLVLEPPEDVRDVMDGLVRWRDWLERHGAAPGGSLGGSGMSLLKATLTRSLWTSVGTVPPIRFAMGGRQEVVEPHPAHYRLPMLQCDIAAAYAQTLGGAQYGGRWDRYDPHPRFERIAQVEPGALLYARAVVDVPELPGLAHLGERRGPLLVRPRAQPQLQQAVFWQREEDLYPGGRRLQGTWSMRELQAAEECGCKIRKVHDVWFHAAGDLPFARWLECIWEGRELGGFASLLAKATGNATWGQFAIAKGKRKVVAVGRDELMPLRGGNPSQRAFDLAEWIAGSVRASLYRGMYAAGPRLVTAHTDGLWVRERPVPKWRVVDGATEMRIFEAQCYAVRTGEQPWRYCVAGALDPAATFEGLWDARVQRATPTPLEVAGGRTGRAARYAVPVIGP